MIRIVDTQPISSTGKIDQLPEPTYPEVAFAGRSNVGKSSLLNALAGRKHLFKVSSTPGRTRTLVHVEARLSTNARLYLVDLPGFGYAKVAKGAKESWARFMEDYIRNRSTLHLVVILVDVRRGPEDEEMELVSFLQHINVPVLFVATKMDRLPKNQRKPVLSALCRQTGIDAIGTSAVDGTGIDELLSRIVRQCHL